jgi:hypothetical protein
MSETYPTSHNSTYPYEDSNHSLTRGEQLMHRADASLEIATELENAMGIDVAGANYEQAMREYLGAHFTLASNEPEPDYTFYLKLGGVQGRLATWKDLQPYGDSDTHDPSKQHMSRDKRENLFNSAAECYETAIRLAGGIKEADPEVLARILSERANMYAIQAEFRANTGDQSEAQVDLINALADLEGAKEIVKHADIDETNPALAHRIDEQDSELKEIMRGNTDATELLKIASESLHELALAS